MVPSIVCHHLNNYYSTEEIDNDNNSKFHYNFGCDKSSVCYMYSYKKHLKLFILFIVEVITVSGNFRDVIYSSVIMGY